MGRFSGAVVDKAMATPASLKIFTLKSVCFGEYSCGFGEVCRVERAVGFGEVCRGERGRSVQGMLRHAPLPILEKCR